MEWVNDTFVQHCYSIQPLGMFTESLGKNKGINIIQIRKEGIKIFLFEDDMVLYIREENDPMETTGTQNSVVLQDIHSTHKAIASFFANTTFPWQERICTQYLQKPKTSSE